MLQDDDPYRDVSVPGWDNLGPLKPSWRAKWFVRRARPAAGGPEAVLKLLPQGLPDKRIKRFYAEATETQKLAGTYGVLPVLDVDRDHGKQPQWYITPLARPLRDQTDRAETLQTIVELLSTVAATLDRLALHGIYHRDIKPDNLFWYDSTPVLADFGIARWAEPAGLTRVTREGERVGPEAFIAPEMRQAGRNVDVSKADVYSLAKTLFALAMGMTYPPDGTHRTDAEEFNFSRCWEADRQSAGKKLTQVLEAATAYYPKDRLTMDGLRAELGHWLTQHPTRIARKEPQTGPVTSGWGPLTNYRRDLDETSLTLYQACLSIAKAVDSDTEPHQEDPEHPVPLLGSYDWPQNSPDGFEADGWSACEVRIGEYDVALAAALWNDEVSMVAELHTRDTSGATTIIAQYGPTPWTRPRMPSAQAHLNNITGQLSTRLNAER